MGRALEKESAERSNQSSASNWLCELGEPATLWLAIAHPLSERLNEALGRRRKRRRRRRERMKRGEKRRK